MGSPTQDLLRRIARLSEMLDIPERVICKNAGLKSNSHLARARSGGGSMGWDYIAPVVEYLHRAHHITLDFLLFGTHPMMREGAGSDAPAPAVVRRKPPRVDDSVEDAPPRPAKHRSRA